MTPAPRERAAERLARLIAELKSGQCPRRSAPEDEDKLLTALDLLLHTRDEAGCRRPAAEEVLRILLSWSVGPATREAVREVHGDMDACEHGPEQVQDSWRFEGLSDALDAFKERLAPLGLWPEEGEG